MNGNRKDWGPLLPTMPVLETLQAEFGDVREPVRAFFGLQHLFGSTASLVSIS